MKGISVERKHHRPETRGSGREVRPLLPCAAWKRHPICGASITFPLDATYDSDSATLRLLVASFASSLRWHAFR